MKKVLLILARILILAIVFSTAVYTISYLTNKDNEDMTTQMALPTFPVLHMGVDGEEINTLYGHKNEMQQGYSRILLTPVSEDNTVPFRIETFGNQIESISYEILRQNGTFVAQSTELAAREETDGQISGAVPVEKHIAEDTEFILRFKITTQRQKNISYYTRIIKQEGLRTAYYINYAREYSLSTLDLDKAESIRSTLETSELGEDSTFHYANIHSTFEHITWERFRPELVSDTRVEVKEMNADMAAVIIYYQLAVTEEDVTDYFNVADYYRLSYMDEQVTFVLDFERTVDQIFDINHNILTSSGVVLGITGNDTEYLSDESGDVVSFVQNGALYSYNRDKAEIAEVFHYASDDAGDIRNTNEQYSIKLIDIDENGNTNFIVYGYINRGDHEGETGVLAYHYSAEKNSVEERAFIPTTKSYEILQYDIETLSYLNENNLLYLYFDRTIYEIDLQARNKRVIRADVSKNQFATSTDGHLLAWQTEGTVYGSTVIQIMNLDTGKEQSVTAGPDEYIRPLGFIDEDFIFGTAWRADVRQDITEGEIFPMYSVKIQAKNGTLQSEYRNDGYYVTEIEILDDMVRLQRVTKNEDGSYAAALADSILSTEEKELPSVQLDSYVTEDRKRQYRLAFSTPLKDLSPTLRKPKQVIFEISRLMELEEPEFDQVLYMSFGGGKLLGVYEKAADAIIQAAGMRGYAVSTNGTCIWQRSGTDLAEIEDYPVVAAEEGKSALAACIQSILNLEGIEADVQSLLDSGGDAASVLESQLDTKVMNLAGTPLSEDRQNQAMYMISHGSPVIGMKASGQPVVIMGYGAVNIRVMDPASGQLEYIGKDDAAAMFANAGNIFISYER